MNNILKVTVETENGSITRHYSKGYLDDIEWYDEIIDMVETNDKQ